MSTDEISNYMNKKFKEYGVQEVDKDFGKNIIEKLNKEKIVIISGFKGRGKTKIVNYIIQKTNYKNSFLYINKDFDLENKLKSEIDLYNLISIVTEKKEIKLIILENIDKIENAKKFISLVYQKGYKIIIIGNDIKISKKPEIEIFEEMKTEFSYLGYSNIEQNHNFLQKENIINKTNSILLAEIFSPYSIKNFELYIYILKFLAKNNKLDSQRNYHKTVEKIIKISPVTFLEYIKYSLQAKILKQIFLYDFKKGKTIESKSKFYFSNIDFRNSLYNFELQENILKENFLFLELEKRGFEIFSGKNGTYDFSFFAKKSFSNGILQNTYFIDFSTSTNRQEFNKQLNKLLKVPNSKNSTISKFLITEQKNKLGIKKTKYDNLEIINFNELLKKI